MKNKNIYIRVLLPVAIILLALVLIFKSGLIGKSVYSACSDSDNTIIDKQGYVVSDDPSIFVKGSVTQGYTTVEDICDSNSSTRLIEFLCEKGYRNSHEMVCQNGCINGACVK